jgi:hypothetical protein
MKSSPLQNAKAVDFDSLPSLDQLDQLALELGAGPQDETLFEAQQFVYDAWEIGDPKARISLAFQAITISPFCADAWLLLSASPKIEPEQRRGLLERATSAGALALGTNGFEEYGGHFWGFHETRPYMRARQALASDLWEHGEREVAIGHIRAMLLLNPGDNQGLRYIVLGWLLQMGDDSAVNALLKDHRDEISTFISYTRVLMALRAGKEKVAENLLAKQAWPENQHVAKLLSAKRKAHKEQPPFYTMGGKDEAEIYVSDYGLAWAATPGAIDWLVAATKDLKIPRRGA